MFSVVCLFAFTDLQKKKKIFKKKRQNPKQHFLDVPSKLSREDDFGSVTH